MSEQQHVTYKNIHVPPSLHERIKAIAEKEQRPMWEVIDQAISYYEATLRRPRLKEDLPWVEKVSWYIAKLSAAIAWYATTKDDAHFTNSMKTIMETETRLGVNLASLKEALAIASRRRGRMRKKISRTIYQALKRAIVEMLTKEQGES